MPRVFEKRAGKDYPDIGVRKGETYYSWTFYRGPTHRSKTRPKSSQLTNKEHERLAYQAREIELVGWEFANKEELVDGMADIIGLLEEARDNAQEKHDNMEQAFQGGNPYMEELSDFVEQCESTQQEVEQLRDEVEAATNEEEFGGCGSLEDVSWPG